MTHHSVALGDIAPTVAGTAWVAPTAVLVGDVTVSPRASIWYGAVLRADSTQIVLGRMSRAAWIFDGGPMMDSLTRS